jgi:isoaspartyl peptidase/L-asparaginase-like protein (Ntn-hydrolase superfamily)
MTDAYIQCINRPREHATIKAIHRSSWRSRRLALGTSQRLHGVKIACDRGFRVLGQGGSAVDRAQAVIVAMEDNSVVNAGRGSSLNFVGEIETDAAIMDRRYAIAHNTRNLCWAARTADGSTAQMFGTRVTS